MILSRQCGCGQNVEFEAEDLAELTCDHCGRSLHEQFAPPKAPPPRFDSTPEPTPAPPPVPPQTSTAKTLELVRTQSCYRTLRELINTIITIGYVLCVLTVAGGFIAMLAPPPNTYGFPAFIASVVSAIIMAIIWTAIGQAMFLGIDAVDLLIANRTDRIASQPPLESRNGAAVDK